MNYLLYFLNSIIITLFLNAQLAFAAFGGRQWQRLVIPGATCGDGSEYSIFWSKSDSTKVAFEFMGGGACWDAKTCYGPTPTSWSYQLPKLPVFGQFSMPDNSLSIAGDHSYVMFTYCTGDVHSGRHVAFYPPGIQMHHTGHSNIQKALKFLKKEKIINFDNIADVIIYGASAGAVGALAHAKSIDLMIPQSAKRTLIADSPGLHFGPRFWSKFSANMVRDFSYSFAGMGVTLDIRDGNLGKQVPKMCKMLSNWNIGVLQGTRDLVMSLGFGQLTPKRQEMLIYGPTGMFQTSRGTGNCWVWAPQTVMHTFLIAPTSLWIEADGVTALDFAQQVYQRQVSTNYR